MQSTGQAGGGQLKCTEGSGFGRETKNFNDPNPGSKPPFLLQ